MNLIKCSLSDIEQLIQIGKKTYYDTFHLYNSKDTMTKYLNEAFDYQKITDELKNPHSSFYFLYDENILTGYMKTNFPPGQSDINDPESLELERIYVCSKYKGRGYGKFMINKAVSIARENRYRKIWLGVWENNNNALLFYKKMGFEIADKHPFRMGDEIQTDLVMIKWI